MKKNQKCYSCKKEIKGDYAYNGHYFCIKCKEKATEDTIKNYMKTIPTTSKELRELIIWAKYEIDEYEKFISICLNQIKLLRNKKDLIKNKKYEKTTKT